MIRYALRRIVQSFFIIIGVLILTFVLFRLSAGDPAAVLLGKNPTPSEIEAMRAQLGSDKPLFGGDALKTEAYRMTVHGDSALCTRLFLPTPDSCRLTVKGAIQTVTIYPERRLITPESNPFTHEFSARIADSILIEGCVESIEIVRLQNAWWNSQLTDTLKELVWIQPEFPYLTFFNYGESITRKEPVKAILLRGILPSLTLMIPIFLGEFFLGIALALFSAAYKDRFWDRAILILSVSGMSISYLAFILFGQYLLAYKWDFFPVWGYESTAYLALPVLIGIVSGLGGGVRFYRTVFVNELNCDYLRTARAKGLSAFSVYVHHLLPNAFVPILSRIAVTLPFLFTGSLLLEKFFGIPGLGFAGIAALADSDLQLLKAIVLLSTLIFVAVNLVCDLLYAWADPRIRIQK